MISKEKTSILQQQSSRRFSDWKNAFNISWPFQKGILFSNIHSHIYGRRIKAEKETRTSCWDVYAVTVFWDRQHILIYSTNCFYDIFLLLSGFLPKQEQVRNMQPKPQDLDINDKAKNTLLEILKDHENGNITSQQLQLAELLAKNSASDVGKVKKQPQDKKHKIKRTSSKTKKPKTEQFPNQNVVIKDNKAVYNGNVDGNLNTKATAPADGSRAYSQVTGE